MTRFEKQSNPQNPDKVDWDTLSKKLDNKDKMQLIRDRKCLSCRIPSHTFKDCQKRKSKQSMRTAAQQLQLKTQVPEKGQHKKKTAIKRPNSNPGEVLVKINKDRRAHV